MSQGLLARIVEFYLHYCLIVISPILERNKHPFACLLLLCGMPVFLTSTNTLVKHAGF